MEKENTSEIINTCENTENAFYFDGKDLTSDADCMTSRNCDKTRDNNNDKRDYDDIQNVVEDTQRRSSQTQSDHIESSGEGTKKTSSQTQTCDPINEHNYAKTRTHKRKRVIKSKNLKSKTKTKSKNGKRQRKDCGSMDIRLYLTVNKVDGKFVKKPEPRVAVVGKAKYRDIRDFFRRP